MEKDDRKEEKRRERINDGEMVNTFCRDEKKKELEITDANPKSGGKEEQLTGREGK